MAWLVAVVLAATTAFFFMAMHRAQYEAFAASSLMGAALFDQRLRLSLSDDLVSRMKATHFKSPTDVTSKSAQHATAMCLERMRGGEVGDVAQRVMWNVFKTHVDPT